MRKGKEHTTKVSSMKRSSNNNSSSSSNSRSSSKMDCSFLSKLETLRNFVDGANFSEKDLSCCLRQCAFNIEMAAEQLMTGQYQPQAQAQSQAQVQKENHHGSSFFSNRVSSSSLSSRSNKRKAECLIRSHDSNNNNKNSSSSSVSNKRGGSSLIVIDEEDVSDDGTSTSTSSGEERLWVLAKRWTVGYCNCRRGSYFYREELKVVADKLVRIRGMNMEGTLMPHLGMLLAPLLCWNNRSSKPLLELTVTTLMEDSAVNMGAEVPIELTIYLRAPFFQLFSADIPHPAISKTAFSLLQWAHYGGDIPLLPPSTPHPAEDTSMQEEAEPAAQEEEEENGDLSNQLLLNNTSTSTSTSTTDDGQTQLEEDPDPVGFQPNIQLRPYQRQALHWMYHREQPNNHNDQDLELWSELQLLSSTHSNTPVKSSILLQTDNHQDKPIVCDCGPVMVTQSIAQTSTTLHATSTTTTTTTTHPLWQQRFLQCKTHTDQIVSFYVNELTQTASSQIPNPPKPCNGGILADAMGLGKTVMLLSLLLKTKQSQTQTQTLVVTPLSLLRQWEQEIQTKTNLTYHSHYAADNTQIKSSYNFQNVDIVLTTYGTLQSEYRRRQQQSSSSSSSSSALFSSSSPLLSFVWKRVILDEAHGIKNPQTITSKACCAIQAERRWCVTGTPIQNSIQDLYGYLKFLQHEPWCQAKFWNSVILLPSQKPSQPTTPDETTNNTNTNHNNIHQNTHDDEMQNQILFSRVRRIIAPLILRRTKDTLDVDGKPIVILPPIDYSTVSVTLSPPERDFYNALLQKSLSVFDGFLKSGTASKSWFAIFSLLQRLRQSCNHIALTVKSRLPTNHSPSTKAITSSSPSKRNTNSKTNQENMENLSFDENEISDKFMQDLLGMFGTHKSGVERNNDNNNINNNNNNKNKSPSHHKEMDGKNTTATIQSNNDHDSMMDKNYYNKIASSLTQAMNENASELQEECAICLDKPSLTDAICTPCAHVFCKDCFIPLLLKKKSNRTECPTCQTLLAPETLITFAKSSEKTGQKIITQKFILPTNNNKETKPSNNANQEEIDDDLCISSARQTLEEALCGHTSSTKLTAVNHELDLIWKQDPGSKVLIFSQFLGFLDLLETSFAKQHIASFRLDGQMTLQERTAELSRFNSYPNQNENHSHDKSSSSENGICRGCVFLVSMKAGGVGINLVAASSVFIVDPWWNAAVEDQCINRIHRIGQNASIVRVRKFVTDDTVEQKIVNLQQKKKEMACGVLDNGKKDSNSSTLNAQPTLADFRDIFGL